MNQEKIGKFISKNRKNKKITQEQLGEKLGVSKNAVSKWERGLNLPDASIMQDLCKILDITLNELFSGERIPDNKYKEVADHNLLNALENSAFSLKDKINFFKNKWEKEHFFILTVEMIIIVFCIIYGFIKDNGLQYLFIIIGFICGIIENNRMMAYVEKNAYGKKSNISIEEFRISITRLKETKNLIKSFSTKKEAVEFLVKQTGLPKKECSEAYDFITKLDFERIK